MKLDCKPACNDPTSQKCCTRQCLRLEQDFQAQEGSLKEAIEARGHLIPFYPKFHCELNFIEFFGLLQNNMHVRIVSTHYRACEILFLYL